MRYIILIYTNEVQDAEAAQNQAQFAEVMEAYNNYTKEMQDAGVFVAGEALHPTSSATSVRVRDGKTMTTDGPFAETKEALGGYYVVKADDLDGAIAWAAKCPGAQWGTTEVRPIMDFE